jgi:hypothetical protein
LSREIWAVFPTGNEIATRNNLKFAKFPCVFHRFWLTFAL